ncbi:Probable cobalt transporter subunit (CbtA) [Streptomyces sp. DvalAA-14]|uniref:CbtA family protein n=1 Tax=unclassified Streptomyces TaxID=2593676 RepID=UPI00081B121B|nr:MULTISPECIES: CbtA family protein [unclassified Streptomyces]MYS22081.1 cobalt transporter [Streptomyces sp. SID4948]SCE08230.1 Probable cobalt transporter subunit (CbtA) [Streptomyces sp. DvalAA-14]
MEKKLILRGLLAGAAAGLLAFLFARIFAEPQIGKAISYENGRDAAQAALDKAAGLPPEAAGPDLFSRTIQADVGIGVGMIVFGMAMGALFAVAYSVSLGRVGALRPRGLALTVAAGGFLGMYLVPFLKYPANPPAIGHEETIKTRSGLYLIMVLCSVAFLVAAVWLGKRLQPRFGNWNAVLLAGAAFVVAIGTVMLLLPSLGHLTYNKEQFGNHATETPLPLTNSKGTIVYPGFPADVLYSFRFYSVAAQLLLWSTIGLVFAPLAERLLQPRPGTSAAREPAPVPV